MDAFGTLRASAVALLAGAALSGCETLSYYAQAIGGQLDLMSRARPVSELLADPAIAPELRRQLERALSLREFASRELGLPDNDSYRRFAEIARPYAVWNVFAAKEFSVEAEESCFPVAGCVAYRGFFHRADAERHAARLRAKGLDTAVLGVPAYSTLGVFSDPLLSSFVAWPEAELARLLFHELAHQLVYVRDDSSFNESFAVVVEREGVRRWLARRGREADLQRYRDARERERRFARRIEATRDELRTLYASGLAPEAMRERKHAVFAALAADPVFERYASRQPVTPNNALLASFATYLQHVPAFERLLEQSGGDLERFYAKVKALAALERAARDRRLERYDSAMSTTLR